MSAPQPLEKQVERAIREYLAFKGWLTIKSDSGLVNRKDGKPRQEAGIPDLIALKGDRAIPIEVKTPRGQLSQAQRRYHQTAVDEYGVRVFVVRCIEDAERLLERLEAS